MSTPTTPPAPATAPDEIYPGITANPQVVHGQPVIAGTRVPVAIVVGHLAAGDTPGEVALAYGLTSDQIQAALAYAADLVGKERVYGFPASA